MFLSFYVVHSPFIAKEEKIAKYRGKAHQANIELNAKYAGMVESMDFASFQIRGRVNCRRQEGGKATLTRATPTGGAILHLCTPRTAIKTRSAVAGASRDG